MAEAAEGKVSVVKTWSRRSTILPDFIGLTFAVTTIAIVTVYVTGT